LLGWPITVLIKTGETRKNEGLGEVGFLDYDFERHKSNAERKEERGRRCFAARSESSKIASDDGYEDFTSYSTNCTGRQSKW
jgi:hypothetical protein